MKRTFTRRGFVEASALAAAVAGMSNPVWLCDAQGEVPKTASNLPEIALGPFKGNRDSLAAYRMPDWFADCKLGKWGSSLSTVATTDCVFQRACSPAMAGSASVV
jgi:hypothetical protein